MDSVDISRYYHTGLFPLLFFTSMMVLLDAILICLGNAHNRLLMHRSFNIDIDARSSEVYRNTSINCCIVPSLLGMYYCYVPLMFHITEMYKPICNLYM